MFEQSLVWSMILQPILHRKAHGYRLDHPLFNCDPLSIDMAEYLSISVLQKCIDGKGSSLPVFRLNDSVITWVKEDD